MPSTPRAIAYVGVGLMGGPMVRRLLSQGYSVRAFDISLDMLVEAKAAGAVAAATPAEAIVGADLVALNLPSTGAVEEAVFGGNGVASRLSPPQILVDFSTIEVARCRQLAGRLKEMTGCSWLDAPVSGGPVASGEGTLAIMAGGEKSDMARLGPLFADLSRNFTHVGPTGSGLIAKMVSQLIVGCLHVVLAEAAKLAELSGIDAAGIPACVAGGHADGELLRQLYPRIVARDFRPRAYARQLVKDMAMVKQLASASKLSCPMLDQALSLYRLLTDRGYAEADVAAVIRLYDSEHEPDPSLNSKTEGTAPC